ncbi:unnamed protein product [Microthlaspi erraticum]|uniref:Uncharacterized protein n=1 Tax=Microthlaspi erraticum TaxID=1685480 RepID=A0A6D2IAP3_9BRAS|nr:unnamed protein product [Microthlaspi erraticum]
MVLENSSIHKSHHHHHQHQPHHHHRNSMKESPRVTYAAEEQSQVFQYPDMRRTKSENVGAREVAKEDDVDKEAEEFINFEHRKFCKWMTKSV